MANTIKTVANAAATIASSNLPESVEKTVYTFGSIIDKPIDIIKSWFCEPLKAFEQKRQFKEAEFKQELSVKFKDDMLELQKSNLENTAEYKRLLKEIDNAAIKDTLGTVSEFVQGALQSTVNIAASLAQMNLETQKIAVEMAQERIVFFQNSQAEQENTTYRRIKEYKELFLPDYPELFTKVYDCIVDEEKNLISLYGDMIKDIQNDFKKAVELQADIIRGAAETAKTQLMSVDLTHIDLTAPDGIKALDWDRIIEADFEVQKDDNDSQKQLTDGK